MAMHNKVMPEALRRFLTEILVANGVPREDAGVEAEVLVWANTHGVDSHGATMVPWYLENLKSGVMNARPSVRAIRETPACLFWDVDRALGPAVTVRAIDEAIAKAKRTGICMALLRNITHQGAMGYYAEYIAKRDMAGVVYVCNPPNMAPWGAAAPGVHNSPVAIGVPASARGSVVLDMALSVVAGGKNNLCIDKGTSIPEGWALDREGRPATDPLKAAVLLPAGGPKGSGLAFMLECLSSILMGNALLEPAIREEAASSASAEGEAVRPSFMKRHIQNSVLLAIDIGLFGGIGAYKDGVDRLADAVKGLPRAEGVAEIFIPGEVEKRTDDIRTRNGIELPAGTVRKLSAIAKDLGIENPFQEPNS
jgi:ureidoglycolate dehydrogenase (NAD+)